MTWRRTSAVPHEHPRRHRVGVVGGHRDQARRRRPGARPASPPACRRAARGVAFTVRTSSRMLRLNSWSIVVIRSLISASRARVASSWSTPARRNSSSVLSSSRAAGRVEPGRVERGEHVVEGAVLAQLGDQLVDLDLGLLARRPHLEVGVDVGVERRPSRRRCSAPASPRPTGAAPPPARRAGRSRSPVTSSRALASPVAVRSRTQARASSAVGSCSGAGRRHGATLGAAPGRTLGLRRAIAEGRQSKVARRVAADPSGQLAAPPGQVGALGLVVGERQRGVVRLPRLGASGRAGGAGRRGSRARGGTSRGRAGRPRPARPRGRRARRPRPRG